MPPTPAFQAAAALITTHRRTLTTPLTSHTPPPPPRPRVQPIRNANSTILLDSTISVPSNNGLAIPISIRAEALSPRRRRVTGSVQIPASKERVWQVVTAYESFPKYVPNVISSRVYHLNNVKYLEQVGTISRKLALNTCLTLRIVEDSQDGIVTFSRVSGRDFMEFEARYVLTHYHDDIKLHYELEAVPFLLFPMALVERKMFKEVPRMLAALRQEVIQGNVIPFD